MRFQQLIREDFRMRNFTKKVIYQIYPKSFKDSNRDGFGDLKGILQKLDYLEDLGVDMIWMNPFYPSPQNDNGYDISDYTGIDPRFGTMEDFEALVSEGRKRKIDFMLDMVLNHTSTEHEWFQKALAGEKRYQDYYILRPLQADGSLPTNWKSKFGGPAWEPFGDTGLYYLHLYDVSQADLNWNNPEVRQKLFDVVNFWMEKGVKGFRFDVINVIGKDPVLLDDPEGDGKPLYTDRPVVHQYLQEMNRASFGRDPEIITVGEMSSTTILNCIKYTKPEENELSMAFQFHHLKVDYENGEKWSKIPFDFEELKSLLHTWGEEMSRQDGWNALFWNNHDQPRALSRFIKAERYRVEGAKMLAAAIHLNRGTPYIYQGEEIGMLNPGFEILEEYRDIETLNAYERLRKAGRSHSFIMECIKEKSRDNSRTPMQWDGSENAGFSEGMPWIGAADHYKDINVEKERSTGSILRFYKKLISLRKELEVVSDGDYRAFEPEHKQIYGFIRSYENKRLLVLNNFYDSAAEIILPDEFLEAEVLLSNYEEVRLSKKMSVKPYQTLALYLE